MSFFRSFENPLIVLDVANNHNGDIEHGKRIIHEASTVVKRAKLPFALKFQYRDLDTFIHPDYRGNHDFPYIKRFETTRLDWSQFTELVGWVRECGGLTACTPFDEASVDQIEEHGFDILKIASASFTDWPLLERVAKTELPIIASTAGADFESIDRVVSFFSHRQKDFALMHCVAAYPTRNEDLQLNRIDALRSRYAPTVIGYSTHEDPRNTAAVKIAVAKGAMILERHIGIESHSVGLNSYSSSPEMLESWTEAIKDALTYCGRTDGQFPILDEESRSLSGLRRGVFLKNEVIGGQLVKGDDVFFSIPLTDGQLTANDWSKYLLVTAKTTIGDQNPLKRDEVDFVDHQLRVKKIVDNARKLFTDAQVVLPNRSELEISHHYGIERFDEFGLLMVTVVNRDYCKKLLGILPGQQHPEQWHEHKEETFNCLHGTLALRLDSEWVALKPGESVTITPGTRHFFKSDTGCVIEEISSTHFKTDSFYSDQSIMLNNNRKTFVDFWL